MPSASSITLAIDTVRTLSMDAVQQAESGHPGTPMALAPLAYALYTRHVKHNPADPHWPDRDRVVLSAGHASMLLYSTLFLSGYDLTLDDLKAFRQWGSKTPGHPEVGHTAGVETTTGPLGQGIGNAVGMAVAEAQLAATFNQDGHTPIDHYTWFIAGDGCLMEGISHEAASFAGHQRLGKLIGFWDDNDITIDGRVSLASRDDVAARFAAYGWQVLHLTEVNDQDAIDRVIAEAKADTARPTLICTKTIIGYGSPNRADTAKAHGEPLGKDEILLTKQAYGWPSTEPFHVPAEALTHWRETKTRGVALQKAWMDRFMAFTKAQPVAAKELGRRWHGDLPTGWEKTLPKFDAVTGNVASRAASGTVLNAIAPALPELLGGSADLTGSNLTDVKGGALFSAEDRTGRNFRYGIREHGMGAIMNGMALHGGVIPYGGTFLVFADYMRPAIRLAALMKQRVIYVFTHDSIGLGEDGPTHQPVEHLTSLRCIPNLLVLRPADANEVAECWRIALMHRDGPSAIILTRQKLSCVDRTTHAPAIDATKGAYILKDAPSGTTPAAVILASGSEVEIALAAQAALAGDGIATRVVSMCSMELFAAQDAAYRASVLPAGIRRVAIEAAHPMSWHRWVGDTGTIIGIATFGASAPAPTLYREYGITANAVVRAVRG
ncbi:MAG: transketolase [Gemmatimonadota bacterium]|nr:transketolase [Gemmatimonadota bacterium]MDQ8147361.1 transketolase [Gemmatimonadota bacterium]MDQ8149593.1 transketolase [Gemmatimonadota bacterium]MDQ8156585.1 transketolase [Gemmatimonadota bacterium]MDQ8176791.1 transketolase [Gemmatimonadota bacterium]